MALILLSRSFVAEGQKVTLTAGVKDGRPLVVLGMPDACGLHQLQNITIEYPMKSQAAALSFVERATDETIARGLARYRDDYAELAERVNAALNAPYKKELGYKTRGDF